MSKESKSTWSHHSNEEFFTATWYYITSLIWATIMANKCTQSVYPLEYGFLTSPDLINFDLNGKSFDNFNLGIIYSS